MSSFAFPPVSLNPIPHLAASDWLPADLYQTLSEKFPATKDVVGKSDFGSNARYDITVPNILRSDSIVCPEWKEFASAMSSPEFFRAVYKNFAPYSDRLPVLKEKGIDPMSLKVGRKGIDKDADVVIDFNIAVNTPVTEAPSRARQIHIDKSTKFFAGLVYFRSPEDDSAGGGIGLYKYKDRPKLVDGNVYDSDAELVRSLPYAANQMLIFHNGIDALHGVEVRSRTPHTRRFVYFSAAYRESLFDTVGAQISFWERQKRKWFPAGEEEIPTVRGFSNMK